MSVLVTGAGLIGRLTAEELAARDDACVLIDIGPPPVALPANVRFEACDITDGAALDGVFARHSVDRVVHTAAMLSTGIRANPVRGVEVNVMGTMRLLEAARRHGARRVVMASSATVLYTTFGSHGPQPIEEDAPLRLVSERPASLYAATKIAGEHLALLYQDLYQLDVVALRYSAVLSGDLAKPTSVPGQLMARLAEGGRTGRRVALDDPFLVWGGREEFVDARDCAQANLAALDAAKPSLRVYNVATGDWHTLAEFVAAMRVIYPALEVDMPPPLKTGFAGFPHQRPAPSCTKAASAEIGFTARYSLDESLRFWTGA